MAINLRPGAYAFQIEKGATWDFDIYLLDAFDAPFLIGTRKVTSIIETNGIVVDTLTAGAGLTITSNNIKLVKDNTALTIAGTTATYDPRIDSIPTGQFKMTLMWENSGKDQPLMIFLMDVTETTAESNSGMSVGPLKIEAKIGPVEVTLRIMQIGDSIVNGSIYIEKFNPSIFDNITRRSYLLNQSAPFYNGEKEAIKVISLIELEYQSDSAKADVWILKAFSKGFIDGVYDNFISLKNLTNNTQVQRSLTDLEISSGYAEINISSVVGYANCRARIWFDFSKTTVQNNWLVSGEAALWNIRFVPTINNQNARIDSIETINTTQNSKISKLETQTDVDNLVKINCTITQKNINQNYLGAISSANGNIISTDSAFYEELSVIGSNYILAKTALFGANNYGYAFYDSNNVCILTKKTTASDYEIIRVPYNAAIFRITYSVKNQGFLAKVTVSNVSPNVEKSNTIFLQPKKVEATGVTNDKTFNTFYKCIVDNSSPNKLYSFELKNDTQIGIVGKIDILSATAYGSDNGWAVLDEDGIIEQSGKFIAGSKTTILITKKSKTFLLSSQSIPIVYFYERIDNTLDIQTGGVEIPLNVEEGYICNSTSGTKIERSPIASYSEFLIYGMSKVEFIGNQWSNNDGGYAFVDISGNVIAGSPKYTTNAKYIVDVPINAYKMRICWLNNTTAQKVIGYGLIEKKEYNSAISTTKKALETINSSVELLSKTLIDTKDGFYNSFGAYINSYLLGKQLETNLFNYRINPNDKFAGGAKIIISNNYIYAVVKINQNSYTEVSSEPIFIRLYKISLTDWTYTSVDLAKIGQTDTFSDSTTYTYNYSNYNPILQVIDGALMICYSARINNVYTLCRKRVNLDTLATISTDYCNFSKNTNVYQLNSTNIKSQYINNTSIISNFDGHLCCYSGHSYYNNYYYVAITSSTNKSWGGLFKTQNFKDFELIFEIPRYIPTKFEISVNVNTAGIAFLAIRTTDETGADNICYLLKYSISNNIILEKMTITDCHTMPLFFRDTKLYLFVGGRFSREYYRIVEVNEDNMKESFVMMDTNNHGIANLSLAKHSDDWIYISRQDGYISRFKIQEKTNAEVDSILQKLLSL